MALTVPCFQRLALWQDSESYKSGTPPSHWRGARGRLGVGTAGGALKGVKTMGELGGHDFYKCFYRSWSTGPDSEASTRVLNLYHQLMWTPLRQPDKKAVLIKRRPDPNYRDSTGLDLEASRNAETKNSLHNL